MKILIVLSLFISYSIAADDCTDITIDTSSMPKNNYQGQQNWCVFWSAADLYSFYEKTPLSSYDMALQYFNEEIVRSESPLSDHTQVGGNITAALILAQQGKGLCLESQTNFTDSDWFELSSLFEKISSDHKSLNTVICENNLSLAKPFNQIPKHILNILNKLSGDKKAAALLDITCGKRHELKSYGISMRSVEKFTEEEIITKLDQLLKAKTPASVSYDKDFIFNSKDYSKKEDNHTSTIIGRRRHPETKACEYLIKDSAGNHCPKDSIYECDKSTGTLWVPRENLQKNIYEVNWLNPPKK